MGRFAIGVALGALCIACGEGAPPAAAPTPASQDFSEAASNRAPIVESVRLDPAEPAQGATLRAVVTARDPDGQPVTLTHRWFMDGAEQRTSGPSFALEGAAKGAEIRLAVTASDGELTSDAMETSARVIDRLPSITATLLKPEDKVAPGQPVTANAMAGDPDGDPIDFEYTWFVNGEPRGEPGALFKTDGLKSGDTIYAEVRASDGANWTEPTRTATVTVGSGHPEFTSNPPGLREDGVFHYQVTAVDPDGDRRLRFAVEKGPEGMAIDDITGELLWRPKSSDPGVHPVIVVVRDSSGLETKQSFSVTIQRQEVAVPAAPDKNAAPDQDAAPKKTDKKAKKDQTDETVEN
jgi:putative Ig domain-containing protein